ncbi:MAG: Glutaredoxin, partial [Candidatus Azambacteria bacterium GW2011_GWD2_46_48]
HNVAFEEFNVAEDEQAREEMIKKSKNLAVPVIDVDGEIIIGFDKAKLEKLLLKK